MKSGSIEIIAAIGVIFVAMINPVWSVIIAVATLTGLSIYHFLKNKKGGMRYEEQEEKKKENLEKILNELRKKQTEDKEGIITNEDVQKLLGVSDSTAERYFDELEKSDKIEQVGQTGRPVFYKLKS